MTFNTIHIRISYIIILFIITLSCKSQNDYSKDNSFSLQINEVKLSKNLKAVIKESSADFMDKFKSKPMVIIVRSTNINDTLRVSMYLRSYLFLDNNERLRSDQNFNGMANFNGTVILMNDSAKSKKIIAKTFKPVKFTLPYNNEMNFSFKKYNIINDIFVIKDAYYSYDLYTE